MIFTHGGSERQMYAAMHYAGDYASLYTQNQFLVSRGFVVLSVNYRGGVGYGVKFRAANSTGWEGAAEYQDVLAAGHYLQNLPNVDAKHVGAYGLSYGGLNTMQALSRNSEVFAAGVANAPVRTFSVRHYYVCGSSQSRNRPTLKRNLGLFWKETND